MAQWPTQLPGFVREGYGIEPQAQFARTDMDAGPARQRRRTTTAPTLYPLRWIFTRTEMEIFEAWFEHEIAGGSAWFEVQIWGGRGYQLAEARFIEPWRCVLPGPVHFTVDARIEVRNRPVMSAAELAAVLGG